MASSALWLGPDLNRNWVGERLEQDRRNPHNNDDPIQDRMFSDGQKWIIWFDDKWRYNDGQVLQAYSEEPVVLMELRSDLKEYCTVTRQFTLTTDYKHIFHRVFRIHNWTLWDRFSRKRTEMMAQRGGRTVKERMLFHGTHLDNVDSICRTGFDYTRSKRSTIGYGTYFAQNSWKASQFTRKGRVGERYPELVQSALIHCPQPPGASVLPAGQGMNPLPVAQTWHQPSAAPPPPPPLPPPLPPPRPSLSLRVIQHPPEHAAAAPPPPPQQPVGAAWQPQAGLAGFSGFQASFPGFQTSFPGFQASFPGFQTSFPGFQSSFPGFQTSFPGFQASFPGFQATYPGAQYPGGVVPVPGPQYPAGHLPNYHGGYFGAVNPAFIPPPVPFSSTPPVTVMVPLPNPQGPVDLRYMFVARVLVGRSKQGAEHITQPPPHADSSVDQNPPQVYAIFNNSQAYPEYLLEYESVF